MNRRGFITSLAAAVAAPAIIRPGLLMPIKPSLMPILDAPDFASFTVICSMHFTNYSDRTLYIDCGLTPAAENDLAIRIPPFDFAAL